MNKLEELRQFVADLFSAATDKTTIEKSAVVNQKFEEVKAEQDKLSSDYASLLKDYKEVVLHASFKPSASDNSGGVPGNFDSDAAFNQFFKSEEKK